VGGQRDLAMFVRHGHSAKSGRGAEVKLLGSAFDMLGEGSKRAVTLRAWPAEVQEEIRAYGNNMKKHLHKGRAYLQVLIRAARERVSSLHIEPDYKQKAVECVCIPETAPFGFFLNGGRIAPESIVYRLRERLEEQQLMEALGRRQLADLLSEAGNIDHEMSAATAGIRTGTHYFSELTHSESNLLLRLRSGAILKTGKIPDCGHDGCKGQTGDLLHILSHVTRDDAEEALHECQAVLKGTVGRLSLEHPIHPATWLGFVPREVVYWPGASEPKEAKKKQRAVRKIAAALSRVGLAAYSRCHPGHPLAPSLVTREEVFRREEFTGRQGPSEMVFRAACDAGFNPQNKVGSVGGVIWRGEEIIAEFWAVIQGGEGASSTLFEYIATLILTATVYRLKLVGVLYEGDNMACIEQVEGEWHTASVLQDLVKEKINHALSLMRKEDRRWIPRERNVEADKRAGWAMLRKEVYLPEPEYRILKNMVKTLWGEGKEFPKGTRRVQGP